MKAGFCKTHMRAFCYSIRDMKTIDYRQMRAYALRNQLKIDNRWNRFIDSSLSFVEQMSSL